MAWLLQKFSKKWDFLFRRNKPEYRIVRPEAISSLLKVPSNIIKPAYSESGTPTPPPTKPEIKTNEQLTLLSHSCSLAFEILCRLESFIKVGITTDQIDKEVHRLCTVFGAYPSPLNYLGFPKSCCTSVNNVACHGIPDSRPLQDGDILNVDVTVFKNGMHGDCSRMYLVGNVDEEGQKLCKIGFEALEVGIGVCSPETPYSAIGDAIEEFVKGQGFTIIPCFLGHGIGSYFHGPPDIYHHRCKAAALQGKMQPGISFTIEPVVGAGSEEVVILDDGWTACTYDESRTAQWEATVAITEDGVKVLTK